MVITNIYLIMGSAKLSKVKPQLPMAETDKKSIKNILKKPFQALFQKEKKNKKNEKKTEDDKPKVIQPPPKVVPVATLLENFKKLEIDKKNHEEEEEDELKNFCFKVIEDERRSERIDSHSSQDSGFSEKTVDEKQEIDPDKDDVIDSLQNLKIDDKNTEKDTDKKRKKLQTVVLKRGPIRNKSGDHSVVTHPYASTQDSADYRQINQVNKQTFSGGQVIVNAKQNVTDESEIERAITQIDIKVLNFTQHSTQEQVDYWNLAQEFLEDVNKTYTQDDLLSDFPEVQNLQEKVFNVIDNMARGDATFASQTDPIEEFTNATHTNFENIDNLENLLHEDYIGIHENFIYPTPPRSENALSPMSDSQASFCRTNSEYILSPERSSPIYNSDYEKYQEITTFEDQYPICITDNTEKDATIDNDKPKARERNGSTSSLTMKQYKDMQKDISMGFTKNECCQVNRRPCKEIFKEHMEKLKMEDRRNMCLKVANLDLKAAYGVLHQILLHLSRSTDQEDLHLALFCLICERIMVQKPTLFHGDFGLSLIKSAVLRCYRRPLLTRYLVQCVRIALRTESVDIKKGHVFHEVDDAGNNLLIACSYAGDTHAAVLAELVRTADNEPPLFDVHHANAEGHNALHVACREHSSRSPRLLTAHVLLEHAAADLWKGDVKGGDTALHLAVNSANCDLRLVMVIFKHVDRKLWKQLAHAQNRSSVTPLEYARSATKSKKPSYPQEVLEFLKKCR